MHTGKVKWFNKAKGYGFIHECSEGVGGDVFLHATVICGQENRWLEEGQKVEFEYDAQGERGLRATRVFALEEAASHEQS